MSPKIPEEDDSSVWPGRPESWKKVTEKADLPQPPFDPKAVPGSKAPKAEQPGEGWLGVNEGDPPEDVKKPEGEQAEKQSRLMWEGIAEDFPELAESLRDRRERRKAEKQARMDRRGAPPGSLFHLEGEEGSGAESVTVGTQKPRQDMFGPGDRENQEVMRKLDEILDLVQQVLEKIPEHAVFGD